MSILNIHCSARKLRPLSRFSWTLFPTSFFRNRTVLTELYLLVFKIFRTLKIAWTQITPVYAMKVKIQRVLFRKYYFVSYQIFLKAACGLDMCLVMYDERYKVAYTRSPRVVIRLETRVGTGNGACRFVRRRVSDRNANSSYEQLTVYLCD